MDHPLSGCLITEHCYENLAVELLEIPGGIGESSLSTAAKVWRGDDSTKV